MVNELDLIRDFFYNDCKGDNKLFFNSIYHFKKPPLLEEAKSIKLPSKIKSLLNLNTLSYKEDSIISFSSYREYIFEKDLFFIYFTEEMFILGKNPGYSETEEYTGELRTKNIRFIMKKHPFVAQTLIKSPYFLRLTPSTFNSRSEMILDLLSICKNRTNSQIIAFMMDFGNKEFLKLYPKIFKELDKPFDIIPILRECSSEYIFDIYAHLNRQQKINRLIKKVPKKIQSLIDQKTIELINEVVSLEKEKEFIHEFCSKISRHKTNTSLNDALNLFIQGLSGWTIEDWRLKLNELNIPFYEENNRIYAEIDDFETMTKVGSSLWCIACNEYDWKHYLKEDNIQYILLDFNLFANDPNSFVGYTATPSGRILAAHDKNDRSFNRNNRLLKPRKINSNDFFNNLISNNVDPILAIKRSSFYYSYDSFDDQTKQLFFNIVNKTQNKREFFLLLMDSEDQSNLSFIFKFLVESSYNNVESEFQIIDLIKYLLSNFTYYNISMEHLTDAINSFIYNDQIVNIIKENTLKELFYSVAYLFIKNKHPVAKTFLIKFLNNFKGNYLWEDLKKQYLIHSFVTEFVNNKEINHVILKHFNELRETLVLELCYSSLIDSSIKNSYLKKLDKEEQNFVLRRIINSTKHFTLESIDYKEILNDNIMVLYKGDSYSFPKLLLEFRPNKFHLNSYFQDVFDFAFDNDYDFGDLTCNIFNDADIFCDYFINHPKITPKILFKMLLNTDNTDTHVFQKTLLRLLEISSEADLVYYADSLFEKHKSKLIKDIILSRKKT